MANLTNPVKNFDIVSLFKSFGYEATQAEIDALAPAFEGRINPGETGRSAVANYVQAHQELKGAQSQIQGNLLSEQEASKNSRELSRILETQGQDAYNKAADLYTQAPKLFGQFTPEQINQYLAPAKQAFDYGLGKATGEAAQRGLGGSSIEGQAIGQQLAQFQQGVLSQGLGIGMQQQQQQAAVLQALGAQKYGASGTQANAGLGYANLANNSAGQYAALAGPLSGLTGAAVNQSLAQQAALQAMSPKKQTFGGKLLDSFENLAVQDVTNIGQNLIGAIPGLGPMATNPGATQQGGLGLQNILSMLKGGGGAGATAGAAGGAGAIPSFTSGLALA